MMSLCIDMASAVTSLPAMYILSSSNGTAFISLLFSLHASVANVMPVEGDIGGAPISLDGSAHRLAINADYLQKGADLDKLIVELPAECNHTFGNSQLVNPVLDPAQRRLRRYAIMQNAHGPEFSEIVSAEFDYVRASYAFRHSGEYRQHDDVSKFMADIAFVGPSEIGYGESEIHQFFQNASFGNVGMGFSLYFCSRVDCLIGAD